MVRTGIALGIAGEATEGGAGGWSREPLEHPSRELCKRRSRERVASVDPEQPPFMLPLYHRNQLVGDSYDGHRNLHFAPGRRTGDIFTAIILMSLLTRAGRPVTPQQHAMGHAAHGALRGANSTSAPAVVTTSAGFGSVTKAPLPADQTIAAADEIVINPKTGQPLPMGWSINPVRGTVDSRGAVWDELESGDNNAVIVSIWVP